MSKNSSIIHENKISVENSFVVYELAIKSKDINKCEQLLKNDPSLIYKSDHSGWTPLYFAAKSRQLGLVKLIFDIERKDQLSQLNDSEKSDFKFQFKLALAADKCTGWTALHIIAKFGPDTDDDGAIVGLFLDNNDDIGAQASGMYKEGLKPLDFAVQKSKYEVIKVFFSKKPELALQSSIRSSSPLKKAVKKEDATTLKLYLEYNPDLKDVDSWLADQIAWIVYGKQKWSDVLNTKISDSSKNPKLIEATNEHTKKTEDDQKLTDPANKDGNDSENVIIQQSIQSVKQALLDAAASINPDEHNKGKNYQTIKDLVIKLNEYISSNSTPSEETSILSVSMTGSDSIHDKDNSEQTFSFW